MDICSLLIECALFTAELYASCFLYKLYDTNARCLKSLREAPYFEIDRKLQKEVEKSNGIINYAIISGSIKALSAPLRSRCIPYLQGVIRENVAKEHKVKWIRFLGSWTSVRDLRHTVNYAPFALCSKTNDLFRKQLHVEVVEPLTAGGFTLNKVYDKFMFCHNTVGDAAVGVFRGERTKAVQDIEKILCEHVIFTAVGKLTIENNELKITQPDNGFKYILTPLTKDSLIYKTYLYMRLLKVGCIIMSSITFISFIYISWRAFKVINRKVIRNREKRELEELRKLRRKDDRSDGLQDINAPKCAI